MQKNDEPGQVLRLIKKDFDRPGTASIITLEEVDTFQQLKEYLTGKFSFLLDTNMDKLLNTLYLIDIDEQKLHSLFSAGNKENIPARLADLVIERQLLKVQTRLKYSTKKDLK